MYPQADAICCVTHTLADISTDIKRRADLSAIAGALVLLERGHKVTYAIDLIYTSATAGVDNNKNKKSQRNLGRAASPPLTADNSYATKSPLVAMGCPTFTPKTAHYL